MKYFIYQINNQVKAIGSNSDDSIEQITELISILESLEFDDSIYPVLARTPEEALIGAITNGYILPTTPTLIGVIKESLGSRALITYELED